MVASSQWCTHRLYPVLGQWRDSLSTSYSRSVKKVLYLTAEKHPEALLLSSGLLGFLQLEFVMSDMDRSSLLSQRRWIADGHFRLHFVLLVVCSDGGENIAIVFYAHVIFAKMRE